MGFLKAGRHVSTRAIVGAYEIDFRIMIGGEVRWISARGQGNDADIVGRIMHGIFIDITGRKQAEEATSCSRARCATGSKTFSPSRPASPPSHRDLQRPLPKWHRNSRTG
jgi:hypothetical protein